MTKGEKKSRKKKLKLDFVRLPAANEALMNSDDKHIERLFFFFLKKGEECTETSTLFSRKHLLLRSKLQSSILSKLHISWEKRVTGASINRH